MQSNRLVYDKHTWNEWLALVQRALSSDLVIPADQLLLARDLVGTAVRSLDPPEGVVPRHGAVLILFYPDGDDLRFPLTVRSERLPNHRGEVSLPGGAVEPNDRDAAATALRECHEELGFDTSDVVILGKLRPIYINPSNFLIVPVVGFRPEAPLFQPNGEEVSAVLTTTIRELLEPGLVITEQWTLRGREVMVPFYPIAHHKVWGATALVVSELVARIRRLQSAHQEEAI